MGIMLPEYLVFGPWIGMGIMALYLASYIGKIRGNLLATMALKAEKGDFRLAFVHYPSGGVEPVVPELEDEMGKQSPTWNVGGTKRFKDFTGEKWETFGNLKIINYTTRSPTPVSPDHAIATDQFDEMLASAGFSTKGIKKDIFYLIAEASKGEDHLKVAWKALGVTSKETRARILEVLKHIETHPEMKYTMFKSGAFTYQTVVNLIDQISGDTVSEISDLISHTEDRVRRQGQTMGSDIFKWLQWAAPLIIVTAIAAATFLIAIGKGA